MITNIAVILLAIAVILQGVTIRRQAEKISIQTESLKVVDSLLGRQEDAMAEFDHRLTETRRIITAEDWKRICKELEELKVWMEKAEDLIEAHAEVEKEAAKSEQLFQEGLTNLLNYGVK